MTLLATLQLREPAEATAFRARLRDLVRTLTGDVDLAARVASQASDLLRWLVAQTPPVTVDVQWERQAVQERVGLVCRVAARPEERRSATGGVRAEVREAPDGWQVTQWHSWTPRFEPPVEALLQEMLAVRSRQELLADLRANNAELAEATRVAQEAARTKAEFMANMSHEIRTPMNAIIGLSHIVLRTELSGKQRDYIRKIHEAGTNLLGIINDILDFSKVEAGRIELERRPFALDDVIQELSTLVGQRAAEKGLEILYRVGVDVPPRFIGDALQIGRAHV